METSILVISPLAHKEADLVVNIEFKVPITVKLVVNRLVSTPITPMGSQVTDLVALSTYHKVSSLRQ